MDIAKILATPADYYSKVASSLRVALTELTSGNIGKIIGHADENRFIERLEKGRGVILVVQLGSLLTKRAAYTAGKVIISMLQAFVGRRYSSDKKVDPTLALHIDEAQSVLYPGIDDLFAKAKVLFTVVNRLRIEHEVIAPRTDQGSVFRRIF